MTHPDPKPPGKQNAAPWPVYWPGLAVVTVMFIVAAAMTWCKWPDLLLDYGVQLYLPWRILHGAVLFRDLFYYAGGPLSQYFNALLFKIFGVSFLTLVLAQLILTALMVVVVFRCFLAAADAWTATLIGLAIVLVFAFGQYTLNGNYTYIAPYSSETVHGLFLSIFTICILSRWVRSSQDIRALPPVPCESLNLSSRRRTIPPLPACRAEATRRRAGEGRGEGESSELEPPPVHGEEESAGREPPSPFMARTHNLLLAMAAGFCTGAVLLTKPDIFFALAVTVVVAFVLACRKHRFARFVKSLMAFGCAGIIPPLFFLFFFLRQENFHDSMRSTVFAWLPIFHGAIVNATFNRWCLGLDDWPPHLEKIILSFLAVVLVVMIYVLVLRWKRGLTWIQSPAIALFLCLSPLLAWAVTFDWRQCGWPLPLLGLAACVAAAWNYKKAEPAAAFPLLWSVFGLVVLSKLGLFPRIFHYGFALAMPAFVSSIYLLYWLLPKWLESRFGVPGRDFRIMAGLVLLIGFGNLFDQSQLLYAKKTVAVGGGADTIISYDSVRTGDVIAALAWVDANLPGDATVAVLPSGVTLNYLMRRINPTPCVFWDPMVMAMFGQQAMTAAFEKSPPDYIFIVEQDTSEFGVGYFGTSRDFGLDLMQWISTHYQTETLIGSEPLKNGQFGIRILKRR